MNISLYLENESLENFLGNVEQEKMNIIENIDNVIKKALECGDEVNKRADIYSSNISESAELYEWLYSFSEEYDKLQVYKKMMMKFIEKCQTIKDEEYEMVKNRINACDDIELNAFVSIQKENMNELKITDIEKWSKVHRGFINRVRNVDEFVKYIEICFLNLKVHEDIKETIKTLNYPFRDYKNEIIDHLAALNDELPEIYNENKNQGNKIIANIFKSTTNIDCSPENDRDTANRRKFKFISESEEEIAVTVNCEMHTKFSTFRKDKDRLYFNPRDEQISKDKVLVAYIGTHLD
jgi:uncharacterized protein Smg (DUF494 family)